MDVKGMWLKLEAAREELARLEAERSAKFSEIFDLVGQAKQVAIGIERRGETGANDPDAERVLATLIDTACSIEATLGLDLIGRVADAYDVPLQDDELAPEVATAQAISEFQREAPNAFADLSPFVSCDSTVCAERVFGDGRHSAQCPLAKTAQPQKIESIVPDPTDATGSSFLVFEGVSVGDRVAYAGPVAQDDDIGEGNVLEVTKRYAQVGWDSGVVTWVLHAELKVTARGDWTPKG